MSFTKTDRIDLMNIGLMFISLFIAMRLPFELFLFSYIILGPLHYMTEIGWLSQRNYFIRKDVSKWPLFTLGIITTILLVYINMWEYLALSEIIPGIPRTWDNFFDKSITSLVFLAFISTLVFLFVKDKWKRLGVLFVLGILTIFLMKVPWFIVIFGIMIPTLIHTTIFTGAFILQGALKSNSRWGYLSFGMYILCHILLAIMVINPQAGAITEYVRGLYLEGEFYVLNYNMYGIFGGEGQLALDGPVGLKIQAYIAFAYTYHYLNWFSKTEVIKWHRIPKKWMIATGFVWVSSIALHLINIKLGIGAIALVSLLHVYLEFPLNYESFIFIGKKTIGKAR